jgi:hypothetical protein
MDAINKDLLKKSSELNQAINQVAVLTAKEATSRQKGELASNRVQYMTTEVARLKERFQTIRSS